MQLGPQHRTYNREPTYEPIRWRRWLALAAVLSVAAVIVFFELVVDRWSTAPLPDVANPADIAFEDGGNHLFGAPSGLSVRIFGEIDGAAEVWADNWEPERLSGRVDWRAHHDWFSPSCTLHYRPIGKVSGRLVVRYKFH